MNSICRFDGEIPVYQKFSDLSEEQVKTLGKAIKQLLVEGPVSDHLGICFNLTTILREMGDSGRKQINAYDIVAELSAKWPKNRIPGGIRHVYSDGTIRYNSYPIDNYPEHPNFDYDDYLWTGEQLELRRELMLYMLNVIGEAE